MITQHVYAIALRSCLHIGNLNYRKLIDEFGSAENVWNLPKSQLKQLFGIGEKRIVDIGNPKHLEFAYKEVDYCHKNSISILSIENDDYPFLLKQCPDAPSVIYIKGNFPRNLKPISIVGTRKMTAYGKQFIIDFLTQLQHHTIVSISGLAYGVDALVHETSLQLNLPTIGVLAHGLDMIYPSKHYKLAQDILEKGGALITEYTALQQPEREYFLQRNRIIAGLSQQTIIVESAFGGGSINTANFANDYNRDIFALPGKLVDKYSQGCNMLIAQNKAQIIHSVLDLVNNCLPQQQGHLNLFTTTEPLKLENTKHHQIYNLLRNQTTLSFDDLLTLTDEQPQTLLSNLLEMELLGYIHSDSSRNYSC